MISRCTNPNDKDYPSVGGMGVTVHPMWMEYAGFLASMGEKPTNHRLVRDPASAQYGPESCAWRLQVITRTHPAYASCKAMRRRCGVIGKLAHSAARYRDRGVYVCDRWAHSFEDFAADMGVPPSPAHSLDRIDPDGPYSPENCRWATRQEQAENTTVVQWVEYRGDRNTVSGWARALGISPAAMQARLDVAFASGKHYNRDRMVRQMAMDGTEVAIHASAKAAAASGVANYAAIMKAISGANKSCGGFRWEYCDG